MRLAAFVCLGALWVAGPADAQHAGETAFWDSVKDSKNPAELQAYLDAYPHGTFAALARIRIGALGGTRHALLWFECTGTEHRDVSGAATDAPSDTQVTEVLALDERTPRLFSYSDGVLEPEPGALHIDRSSIRLEAEAAAQGGFVKMVTTLNRSTGALRIVLITTINRLSSYTRQEHCVEVPAKLGK